MSRRVRRVESDSSLELLLDTICNTFGGILFIALLVSILMSQRSAEVLTKPVDQSAQAAMNRFTAELETVQQELDEARKSSELLEQLSTRISDPEIKRLLSRKEDLEKSLERIERMVSEELVDVSQEQKKVNETTNEIAAAQNMLEGAKRELDELKKRLGKAIEDNSRVAGFPIAQSTSKSQVTVCIGRGKICFLEQNMNGTLVDDPSQIVDMSDKKILPDFDNGVIINKKDGLGSLHSKINEYKAQNHFFRIFIWKDSFETYQTFSDIIAKKRFSYEVNPMIEGDYLVKGPSNARVQ
jgi:SMC interacting uncharacterized protein involved in chromosome segregation